MSLLKGRAAAAVAENKSAKETTNYVQGVNHILPTANRWRELRFDPDKFLGPVYEPLAKAQACHQQLTDRRRELRAALLTAREDYAKGAIDLEALEEISERFERIENSDSALTRSISAARAILLSQAEVAFGDVVADTVWPLLVAGCESAVARSVELANQLPAGVVTRDDARRAGFAEVWGSLGGIVNDEWDTYHAERQELTRTGYFSPLEVDGLVGTLLSNVRFAIGLWLRYQNPEKLPRDYFDEAVAPELRLATAVQVGAEPGMYSVDDATQRFLAWRTKTERLQGRFVQKSRDSIGIAVDELSDASMAAVMNLPGVAKAGFYGMAVPTRDISELRLS